MKTFDSWRVEGWFVLAVMIASLAAAVSFGAVFTFSDPGFVGAVAQDEAGDPPLEPPSTNLEIWLRTDSGVDVGGGFVTNWSSVVNGHNFTNRAGSRMPTLVSAGLNGFNTIQFDGTDLLSTDTAPAINQPSTIYIVMKTEVHDVSADTPFDGYTASTMRLRQIGSNSAYGLAAGGTVRSVFTNAVDTWYYNMCVFDDPTGVEGSASGGTTSTAATSGTADAAGMTLGSAGAVITGGWQGEIAEVLVYTEKHDSTERTQTKAYLADRYGL